MRKGCVLHRRRAGDLPVPVARLTRCWCSPPSCARRPGRPGAVPRQALLSRLSEDHPWVRLVVISAPAGWGKTCLLRDWRLGDTASGTAWMSVDAGDNDPVRFWAPVIAGVTCVSAGFGAAALRVLTAAGGAAARHPAG